MPTEKIADLPPEETCLAPGHEPPSLVVWPAGSYKHTCPACGRVVSFTVRPIRR